MVEGVIRNLAETLLPMCFAGDWQIAFGESFFHFTKAEAESRVESHSITENFGRESVTLVVGW